MNKRNLFRGQIRSSRLSLVRFLAVVAVGLVGSYLLVGAKAFDFPVQPPHYFTYFEDWIAGGANGLGPDEGWSKDETIGIEIHASFVVPAGEAKQLIVVATADMSRVKYLQYDCGEVGACSNSDWTGSQDSLKYGQYQAYATRNATVCIDVPPGSYSRANLLTVRYRSLVSLRSPNPSAAPDGWFAVRAAATDGSCASNRSGSGAVFGDYEASEGGCGGGAFTSSCTGQLRDDGRGNDGIDNGSGEEGAGSDGPKGEGTGPTGSGTGGGSSGSTATKNGNDPNSTPSSSNQGNKDQTKLDPSPFYDGKQYQRGSESDSGLGGLFNKPASGGIAKGWYLLTALTLLAGGGGIWWRMRKRG